MDRRGRAFIRHGLAAGAVGGVVGGVPSTAIAVLTGGDPFEATLATGTILLPSETRASRLIPAAALTHSALSLGWGIVLARLLPRRQTLAWGAAAGAGIAALDLGLGRILFHRVRQLEMWPQVLDHITYGAVVGAVVGRLRMRDR